MRARVAVVVVVLARELGPGRRVVLEHDLLWVGRARQELLAGTDLLEDLFSLRDEKERLDMGIVYRLDSRATALTYRL